MRKNRYVVNMGAVFIIVTVVLFGFVIAFFASFPHYSETYKGTLSVNTYRTAEEASVGYLSEQLNSLTETGDYVDCVVTGVVSDKQKRKFGLDGYENVEEMKIIYRVGDDIREATFYICRENDGYKYFAPPLYAGEGLTSGYYESVVKSSAMQNCTLKLQAIGSIRIFGIPVKSSTEYTMKIADGMAYYKEKSGFLGFKFEREIYCFNGPNEVLGIMKESMNGINPDTGEFESYDHDWALAEITLPFGQPKRIEDFSLFGIYDGMDHSFFEKTKTGFTTKRSRKRDFTAIVAKNLTERAMIDLDVPDDMKDIINKIYLDDANWDYDCNYIVDNGYLRQAYMKSYIDLKDVDWTQLGENPPEWFLKFMSAFSVESSMKCDIVDVGKTSFTVADDAMKLIEQYK